MATKKFLGTTGLTALWSKIKTLVASYVPTSRKINNKALTTDISLTAADVGAAASSHTHNYAGSSTAGGAANSVANGLTLKLNGGATEGTNMFTFNGSAVKNVNITPLAIGAATATDIATAIAAIDKISKLIVATLPSVASAQQNIIYLVPGGGSDASDNYDEYMLINGAFEKLGNTAIDLSEYVQDSDLIEITSAEIDALV